MMPMWTSADFLVAGQVLADLPACTMSNALLLTSLSLSAFVFLQRAIKKIIVIFFLCNVMISCSSMLGLYPALFHM